MTPNSFSLKFKAIKNAYASAIASLVEERTFYVRFHRASVVDKRTKKRLLATIESDVFGNEPSELESLKANVHQLVLRIRKSNVSTATNVSEIESALYTLEKLLQPIFCRPRRSKHEASRVLDALIAVNGELLAAFVALRSAICSAVTLVADAWRIHDNSIAYRDFVDAQDDDEGGEDAISLDESEEDDDEDGEEEEEEEDDDDDDDDDEKTDETYDNEQEQKKIKTEEAVQHSYEDDDVKTVSTRDEISP
jgi:hypothetical protein